MVKFLLLMPCLSCPSPVTIGLPFRISVFVACKMWVDKVSFTIISHIVVCEIYSKQSKDAVVESTCFFTQKPRLKKVYHLFEATGLIAQEPNASSSNSFSHAGFFLQYRTRVSLSPSCTPFFHLFFIWS